MNTKEFPGLLFTKFNEPSKKTRVLKSGTQTTVTTPSVFATAMNLPSVLYKQLEYICK